MIASWWRPLLRAWYVWEGRRLAGIPRPLDRAFASAPGSAPLECVAFGSGPLAGWGVATHQLGLPGAIARSLARRFSRGVTVRGDLDPALSAASMPSRLAELPWASAQVGILSFGPGEILTRGGLAAWRRSLGTLIAGVQRRMPVGSAIVVIGIPLLSDLPWLRGPGRPVMRRQIPRFNDAAREICAAAGVRFVILPDPGPAGRNEYRSAAHYTLWGEVIASSVDLDPAAAGPAGLGEPERARAVERLGILDTPPEERFDRVVRLARATFQVKAAAFTVLYGDRQWNKASVGWPVDELPREYSFCELPVGQGRPVVIGDAWADPRVAGFPRLHDGDGVRFYAGHPLRAPGGEFIGALCVLDPEPRDARDVDLVLLRDLALIIEAELAG